VFLGLAGTHLAGLAPGFAARPRPPAHRTG
jgi:hypothetical protein